MSILLPLLFALPAAQAVDHSPLHPKEAILFVQAPDIPALETAYRESSWAAAVRDEELQEGVAAMLEIEASELRDLVEPLLAEMELDLWAKHASAMRSASISVCVKDGNPIRVDWFDLLMDNAISTVFRVHAVLEFSTEQAAAAAHPDLAKALEELGVPACELEGSRVIWNVGELPVSSGSGPALEARWGALGAELGEPKGVSVIEAYSPLGDDGAAWMDGLFGYSGLDGPLGQVLTSTLGAPPLVLSRGGAWRVGALNGEFYTSGRFPHRAKSAVDEVFGAKALTAEDLAFIHPNARVAGAISVDPAALVPWASSLVAQCEPMQDAEAFEELYGFQPIRDLVMPLGKSMHWSLQGNLSLGVLPSQFSARVTDEAAMLRGIHGLARYVEAMSPETIKTKVQKYKGAELITFRYVGEELSQLDLPFDLSLMIRPTITVFDGRVLITPNRTLARREIKRVRGEQTEPVAMPIALARNANYTTAGSVTFGDWMAIVGRMMGMAKSMGSLIGPGALPFNPDLIPDANLLTRHFEPSIETQTHFESCVHYESRSCMGIETVLLYAAGFGAIFTQMEPMVKASQADAGRGRCAADLVSLRSATMQFAIRNGGDYPESLAQLVTPDENGRRYIEQSEVPKDPWGNEYIYDPNPTDDGLRLRSMGPDGIDNQGEGDDISVGQVLQGQY